MAKDHTMFHLGVANPDSEPACFSVPILFRRTADAIDDLGEVDVHDLVLQAEGTTRGRLPSVAVYYSRPDSPTSHRGCQHGSHAAKGAGVKIDTGHEDIGNQHTQDMAEDNNRHRFYLSNSLAEIDHCSVPQLLRRSADHITILGVVDIHDLVLEIKETAEGREPTVTVYYSRPDRQEKRSGGDGGGKGARTP